MKTFLFAILVSLAWSWGYAEDNCFDCFNDKSVGEMYFCRHNSSGLIWGQCCLTGTNSNHHCIEQFDSSIESYQSAANSRCSDRSPPEEMNAFYCLPDKVTGMEKCGLGMDANQIL